MLEAAREALVQYGVIAPGDPLPPFHAKLGGNLVLGMLVYKSDGSFYVVKVALESKLDREFHGLSVAHAAMPRNVPRPLGLSTYRSFPVLVSCGVRHNPLVPIHGGASMQRFENGVGAYLATSARAFLRRAVDEPCIDLAEALQHTAGRIDWPGSRDYSQRIAPFVAALPRIHQHGDLSVNNIGVAHGELVFFDWEDFGLVDLPGFDLAVLLLSLNAFDLRLLLDRLDAPSLEQRMMRNGCTLLGISSDSFLMLFPAYLSLFARMKGLLGYAPEVAGRAVKALAQFLAAAEHEPRRRPFQRFVQIAE